MMIQKIFNLYKSLGDRMAHLEVPSSFKISIPPIWLLGKKWVQWGPDNMNTRLSMRGFCIKLKDVTVIWISYFLLFRFLVLYLVQETIASSTSSSTRKLKSLKWEIGRTDTIL